MKEKIEDAMSIKDMEEKERQIEEAKEIENYLKQPKAKWNDLSENEKKLFEFIYRKIVKKLHLMIGYEILPKIWELDERTESKLKQINDFDKFVTENQIAVVDVWQTGCLPCNLVEAPLEKLARRNEGMAFGRKKLDNKLMDKFKIESIPTILLFDNGRLRKRIVGAVPNEIIEAEVEALKVSEEDFNKRLKLVKAVAKARGWTINSNPKLRNMLIVGLIKNKGHCPCKPQKIQEHLCPCRPSKYFKGSEKEIEKNGHCYCGLFFKKDFKGQVSEEYILKHFANNSSVEVG